MRVCYHIQSHRDPTQVVRLVRRLQRGSPDSVILVSHQVGGEELSQRELRRDGEAHVLPTPGGYGDFSHVDRYLESVAWLVDHHDPFEWFVNITGQDYPLVPGAVIESQLAASTYDAWMQCFPVFSPKCPWPPRQSHTRYDFAHRRICRVDDTRVRALRPLAALNRAQPLVRFSPSFMTVGVRQRRTRGADVELYGGSFFANLSRTAALHVHEFAARDGALVRRLRRALAPDEVFLQTVLVNSGAFTIHEDCKRYFDFSQHRGNHPKLLGLDDLEPAVASNAWFARKVDAGDDPELLDRLDDHNGWAVSVP